MWGWGRDGVGAGLRWTKARVIEINGTWAPHPPLIFYVLVTRSLSRARDQHGTPWV